MARNKSKSKREREESSRKRRREKRRRSSGPRPPAKQAQASLLGPADPGTCFPPLHVSVEGRLVPDPVMLLGLEGRELTPESVRAAWRDAMLAYPPEQHPEMTPMLREARDRLLDPAKVLERALGVLHIPRPEAFGSDQDEEAEDRLDSLGRLLAQAALYALVEEDLLSDEQTGDELTQIDLPF